MIGRRRGGARIGAVALAGALALAGCASGVLGPGDEQEHIATLAEFGGSHRQGALLGLLEHVTARLAPHAAMEHDDAPAWRAYLVDSPTANAFARPDGRLYFTRGLLAALNSEDELAFVVGHEMGHVVARHSLTRQAAAVIGRTARVAAVLAGVDDGDAAALERLTFTAFSRSQELEADALGFSYALQAGYDPAAAAGPHRTLLRFKRYRESIADEEPGYSIVDTHPPHPQRIVALNDLTKVRDPAAIQRRPREDAAYLARLDGVGWGADRAAGYVQGREFLHPRLGLRFRVPAGYRLSLSPRRVVAENPTDGGLILFDAAPLPPGQSDPAAYLAGLWAEAGGVVGVVQRRLAGWPAAEGEIRLASPQGESVGRAAAIADQAGGRVFRFVCLPTSGDDQPCRETFASLAAAGEADWRRRPAARLEIIDALPGEKIAALAAGLGWIPQSETLLRALNGLDDGEEPTAGRKLKLIVAD